MYSTRKKQILSVGLASILVFTVFMSAFLYLNRKIDSASAMTVDTELKMNAYNDIDKIAEDLESRNIDSMIDWSMDLIKDTLKENKISLSATEEGIIRNQLYTNITKLYEEGKITFNDDGSITSLTKSYISNLICQTTSDLKTEIPQSNTVQNNYTQVVDVQSIMQEINNNTQKLADLSGSVDVVLHDTSNLVQSQVGTDTYINTVINSALDKVAYVAQSDLTDTMEAYKTIILADAYKQTKTYTDEVVDEVVATGERSKTVEEREAAQQTAQNNNTVDDAKLLEIQQAVTGILTTQQSQADFLSNITETVGAELQNTGVIQNVETTPEFVDLQTKYNTLQESLTDVSTSVKSGSISVAKDELNKSIETLIQDKSSYLSTALSDLQSSMDANKSTASAEVTTAINNLKAELVLSQDSADDLLNKAIQKVQGTVDGMSVVDKATYEVAMTQISNNQKSNDDQFKNVNSTLISLKNLADSIDASGNKNLQDAVSALNAALANENLTQSTALDNAVTTINDALNTANTNQTAALVSSVTELTALIDQSSADDAAALSEARQALQDALDTSNVNQSTALQNAVTALNTALDNTNSALDSRITSEAATLSSNLTTATNELNALVASTKSTLDTDISNLSSVVGNNRVQMESTLNSVSTNLADSISSAEARLNSDLSNLSAEQQAALQAEIDARQNALDILQSYVDDGLLNASSSLEDAITQIDSDLATASGEQAAALQSARDALEALIAEGNSTLSGEINSIKSHNAVDVISDVNIADTQWDNHTYTITNAAFKDCANIQVNYRTQYDMCPEYSVDTDAGTLTITTDNDITIIIDSIIVYHSY